MRATKIAYLRRPWPYIDKNLVLDFEFINRRWWWAGRERGSADFTTFDLSTVAFDQFGMTPTSTVNMTLALSNFADITSGSMLLEVRPTSTPAAGRTPVAIDDGTTTNAISVVQNTAGGLNFSVLSGGVGQANIAGTAYVANSNAAIGVSWNTNSFLSSTNGTGRTADVSGALPVSPTTLRIGKSSGATTELLGSLKRLIIFNAVKTQGDINDLAKKFSLGAEA